MTWSFVMPTTEALCREVKLKSSRLIIRAFDTTTKTNRYNSIMKKQPSWRSREGRPKDNQDFYEVAYYKTVTHDRFSFMRTHHGARAGNFKFFK